MHRFFCSVVLHLLVWVLSGVCTSAFAITASGSIIYNSAELSYEDARINKQINTRSNTASISVGRKYDFSVEYNHSLEVDPGVIARFPHKIVNNGNSDDSYTFSFSNLDPKVFGTPEIYLDLNRNGQIDSYEPAIDSTSLLQEDQSVDIIIISRLSPLLEDGFETRFEFSIVSETDGTQEYVSDNVIVGSPGKIELALTTFPTCDVTVFSGDTITHTVEAIKKGHRQLRNSRYLIDGDFVEGVVFEIAVSQNTRFIDFDQKSTTTSGVQLVKLDNSADNQWHTPSSLTEDQRARQSITSAGLLLDLDTLTAANSAKFTVTLEVVDRESSDTIQTRTAFIDLDSDRIADQESNSSCTTFNFSEELVQGELRFITPSSAVRESGEPPDHYNDSDFVDADKFNVKRKETTSYVPYRDGLYLELSIDNDEHVEHSDIFTDSEGNHYVIVILRSELTKDWLQVVMLETKTPGIYRSVAPIVLSSENQSDGGICPVFNDNEPIRAVYEQSNPTCVMASRDNDRLNGLFGDEEAGLELAAATSVAQQNIVFDTHTLSPVAGAVVQILSADNDTMMSDSVTGEELEYVTGEDGHFSLPQLLDDKRYYLNVIPPLGYSFPSNVLPFRLPTYTVSNFSYGSEGIINGDSTSGIFFGSDINKRQANDIPLDLSEEGSLLAVDKIAIQTVIDIGQSVSYVVTVKNASAEDINQIVVEDTLPFGFRYVKATSRLSTIKIQDPVRNAAGSLIFDVGTVAADESVTLSYSLRASAAALDGDGVNTAVASGVTSSNEKTRSLPGRARITLQRGGAMSSKAALFGKLYVEQNCDGFQNKKEQPIAGVRLYLQNGTYAITDKDGLYSLYGLDPGQYVVKVDAYTLPDTLTLKIISSDQAGSPDSRFVRLSEGDFHKVDFAASCPDKKAVDIFKELEQRSSYLDDSQFLQSAEVFNSLEQQPSDNPQSRMIATDGDISSGLLDGHTDSSAGSYSGKDNFQEGSAGKKNTQDKGPENNQSDSKELPRGDKSTKAVTDKPSADYIDAKQAVATITHDQAKAGTWLWPRDDISLNSRFIAVIRAGIEPTLYVNDVAVSASNLGERLINKREKAQIVAWYGVELKAGENTVEIKGEDSFGNERVLATGVFKRPSSGSQIELIAEKNTVPADAGRSVLPITVRILDSNGYPALGVYYITLESSDGSWKEADIQDSEPGRQIRIDNGERTLHYRPSGTTGEVRIVARTQAFSDELELHQVAEVRPLIVSGFIQAGASYSTDDFGNFSPSTDLGDFSRSGQFDSRTALFVKGTIRNNYNLTLSYDSDKKEEQQLLRDLNPILHYPIQGDSSVRGFEAQSRSKLYVKLERNKSSAMWGDYLTDAGSNKQDLAGISRALTGFNSVVRDGDSTLRFFAAKENNQNITEEIQGNGSSMLYRLKQYPIVPNSEIVELVTRSKDNPGLVIETVRLSGLGDYTVDDDLGFLAFAATIPTLDGEQNPVYIRIRYDVMGDGDSYLVSGVRFDRQVTENLFFGASFTYNGHNTEGAKLLGMFGDYRFSKKTQLSASFASSDSHSNHASGNAHTIKLNHQWLNESAGITTITRTHADADFHNSGTAAIAGRTETKLEHSQNIGSSGDTRLLLDANSSKSAFTNSERRSVGALIETTYKNWRVRTGLRKNVLKNESGDDGFLNTILGLRRKFSFLGKKGEANIDYEQDVGYSSRRRVTVGGKLNVHDDVKTYANYELSNSLLGLNGMTGTAQSESLVLGVESQNIKSTRLFSEYRIRDAFDTQEHETASGIRGDYVITEGVKINPNFEYIRRISTDSDSVAASLGITDTRNPDSRKILRLETRHSEESNHYGIRASYAARLNPDWTAMMSDKLSRQTTVGSDAVLRHSFTVAAARRPKKDNRHHMLFMYRLRQEKSVTEGLRRSTHVLSTHQNYQLDDTKTLFGRLGIKQDNSVYNDNDVTDLSMLIDSRVNYEISARTSIEALGGALSTNSWTETRYSLGVGVNYTVNTNAQLSVGYNFIGFRDNDLDSEKYNAEGARISLQYKLDEDLFEWLR